jgi:hypothetical protein
MSTQTRAAPAAADSDIRTCMLVSVRLVTHPGPTRPGTEQYRLTNDELYSSCAASDSESEAASASSGLGIPIVEPHLRLPLAVYPTY